MFACVTFEDFELTKAIPLEWVFQVDVNTLIVNGINSSERFKIFNAEGRENEKVCPNFTMAVERKNFQPVACYNARIFRICGKCVKKTHPICLFIL